MPCFFRCGHHAPEDVPEAIGDSLNDLQLEYLDLYLVSCMHLPVEESSFNSLITRLWFLYFQCLASGPLASIYM